MNLRFKKYIWVVLAMSLLRGGNAMAENEMLDPKFQPDMDIMTACQQQVITALLGCQTMHCDYENPIMESLQSWAASNENNGVIPVQKMDRIKDMAKSYEDIRTGSDGKCILSEGLGELAPDTKYVNSCLLDAEQRVALAADRQHTNYIRKTSNNTNFSVSISNPPATRNKLNGQSVMVYENELNDHGVCKMSESQ